MVTVPYSDMQIMARNQMIAQMFNGFAALLFIFMLLFATGAIMGMIFPPTDDLSYDNPFLRLVWYPVYALALFMSLFKLPQVLRMATFSPFVILAVLYCGISMMWSIDPAVTVRRAIALLLTTYMGLTLAAWFSWARMVQIIATTFVLAALLCFVLYIIDPSRAVMSAIHVGAWQGPFAEKNQLGGMMTKGLIACLCAFALRPKRWWAWVPGAGLCFLLVLLSTSKTALLISLLAILLFTFLKVYRTNPFLRIPLVFGLVASIGLMVGLIALFPVEMFGLIGKDPTLTGRTDIWTLLTQAIQEKYWLGYGYGVFWQEPLGPSYIVRQVLEWGVPSAHNGWIEIWLSCGIGIVAIFAVHCLFTLGLSLHSIKRGGREVYFVVLTFMAYIGFSMSESAILQQNSLSWIMFVATCAKLFSMERAYRPLRD